jgi:hypothetical protein
MAIRHVVTIQVAHGKLAEFTRAFETVRAIAQSAAVIGVLVALWAPGTTPTVERFDA